MNQNTLKTVDALCQRKVALDRQKDELENDYREVLAECARANMKIAGIKLIRSIEGGGLKEAKEAYEDRYENGILTFTVGVRVSRYSEEQATKIHDRLESVVMDGISNKANYTFEMKRVDNFAHISHEFKPNGK